MTTKAFWISTLAVNARFLDAAVDHVINEIVSLEWLYSRLNARSHSVFTFDDGIGTHGRFESLRTAQSPMVTVFNNKISRSNIFICWGALEGALLDRDVFEIETRSFHRKSRSARLPKKRAAFELIRKIGLVNGPELASYLAERYNVMGSALLAKKALSWAELRGLVSGSLMELGGDTITHSVLTRLSDDEAR